MPLISTNPATGEIIKEYPELTPEAVTEKIIQAEIAYTEWQKTTFAERAGKMKKLAEILRAKKQILGRIMSLEMGKPITAATAEVEKCAWVADYYADNAEKILQDELTATEMQESYVRFDPMGIILAIMPWNFPFWQVVRFAAPALMAGNVGLLKHASCVSGCALALEEIFLAAGFPVGAFTTLLIGSDKVETVIADDRVKAVTLTGSEAAGSKVASLAGKLIKKTVLELGGSDPFIILSDANIAAAAAEGVLARLQNAGQSCIAGKRFIVVADRYDEFLREYLKVWQTFTVGDPLDEATKVGPLISAKAVSEIDNQVQSSIALGARLVAGGKRWGDRGFFYEPTILAEVKKGMPAYDEEVFGPVAAVIKVADTTEAIRVANDTPYGLGASLWTADLSLAKTLATQIQSGCVFVNSMVKSDPRLPFGGIKKSGFGRELSHYGIKEFVNIKTVVIK
ncbi:MAG: NAD-dependent succinate-semialdehyde dehydrogenase [bacterium]|nr:NAD-dependent succinate-semialdehyde dehydrogenase [bacterium]